LCPATTMTAAAEEEIALLRAEDAHAELVPPACPDMRRTDSPGVAKPVADAAPEGACTGARAIARTVAAVGGKLVTIPATEERRAGSTLLLGSRPIRSRAQARCPLSRSGRQMITRKSLRKDQPITCGDGGPGVP
jgi:hypothetical protein